MKVPPGAGRVPAPRSDEGPSGAERGGALGQGVGNWLFRPLWGAHVSGGHGEKRCQTGAWLQDSPRTWSLGSGESGEGCAGGVTPGPVCAQTLQYLQQNAKERAELAAAAAAGGGGGGSFGAPAAASKMSMQELEELRKQLGSVATGSTAQQVPSSAGRV